MNKILFFESVTETDTNTVGGKALSLAHMANAGLPVPPGFVLTTEAYARHFAKGIRTDPEFMQAVLDAYHRLGRGSVAVRSSATAEDGTEASFAGQQETILGVQGDEALLDAIEQCWRSLHTERAVAYRRQKGIPDETLAMAVVVQTLVPAEVAGVLFTRDPHDPTGSLLSIEASWGLGEAVVSGRVTPDRFRLNHDTGSVVERHAGRKLIQITPTGEEAVSPDRVEALCLNDSQLSQIAELGRKVEAFYHEPRDVEWAYVGGTFLLLQARPITTGSAAEREQIRTEVISELRGKADPAGTVWVKYNLNEVLPDPTPMTWSIVQRLLAADGGFGAMNRDLGASPDPALGSLSAFDLIAGRPMCNLSRLPRMQFANPPVEYPLALYKSDPRKALDPKPILNPARGGWRAWLRLPSVIWRLFRIASATRAQAQSFGERFTKVLIPSFTTDARTALAQDWAQLEPHQLKTLCEEWIQKTLIEFARESLKPTVFADLSWNTLVDLLKSSLGEERARTAVGELALGAKPLPDSHLAEGVRRLSNGEWEPAQFLQQFGHRAESEMELSAPRWSEDPAAVDRLKGPEARKPALSPSLQALQEQIDTLAPKPDNAQLTWERIAAEAKLTGPALQNAATWVERLRLYLGLRESAKHYLLLGYAVIRRTLVELDQRLQLRGGIFYLRLDELPELFEKKDLTNRIAQRKKRRQLELSLEVPPVLFSDDLESIGRPMPLPAGAQQLEGIALSAGVVEAPAFVVSEPQAPPAGAFILVCPSTNPAWVPLFASAKGLVMETGGVLSHGAIVAREFGLPAVAGLPGVTRQIRTGQMLRVDGGRGTVVLVEKTA